MDRTWCYTSIPILLRRFLAFTLVLGPPGAISHLRKRRVGHQIVNNRCLERCWGKVQTYIQNSFMIFLLILLLPFTSADVIRTVYCKNLCNDYLHVPESQMPACPKEPMKLNECGTVITCDWRDAEKDKVRPIANTTSDFTCCYRSQIKEKGDCDSQVEAVEVREPPAPEVTVQTSKSSVCADATIPWMVSAVLAIVVLAETGYLLWSRLKEPVSQKVAAEPPYCQRPLYTARPLLDHRLLA